MEKKILGCSFPNQMYETILDWKTFGFIMSNNYTFAKHWEDIFSKPNLFQIKYVQHVIPGFPHVFTTQNSPPQPVSPVRAGCSESRLRQIPLATRGPSPSWRRRRCFQAGAERTGGCGPTRPRRPRSRTGWSRRSLGNWSETLLSKSAKKHQKNLKVGFPNERFHGVWGFYHQWGFKQWWVAWLHDFNWIYAISN